MPGSTAYKSLELYHVSKKLAIACYELTHDLPESDKTHFSAYMRQAALQVHINLAGSVFKKPKKRKKYIRSVRNNLVIINAATEILIETQLVTRSQAESIIQHTAALNQLLDTY